MTLRRLAARFSWTWSRLEGYSRFLRHSCQGRHWQTRRRGQWGCRGGDTYYFPQSRQSCRLWVACRCLSHRPAHHPSLGPPRVGHVRRAIRHCHCHSRARTVVDRRDLLKGLPEQVLSRRLPFREVSQMGERSHLTRSKWREPRLWRRPKFAKVSSKPIHCSGLSVCIRASYRG